MSSFKQREDTYLPNALPGIDTSKVVFDNRKFNGEFDRMIEKRKTLRKFEEEKVLNNLEEQDKKVPIKELYDFTLGELFYDMDIQLSGLVSDIVKNKENNDLLGNRRLLYIGILSITVGIFVWCLTDIFDSV